MLTPSSYARRRERFRTQSASIVTRLLDRQNLHSLFLPSRLGVPIGHVTKDRGSRLKNFSSTSAEVPSRISLVISVRHDQRGGCTRDRHTRGIAVIESESSFLRVHYIEDVRWPPTCETFRRFAGTLRKATFESSWRCRSRWNRFVPWSSQGSRVREFQISLLDGRT